MEASRAEASQSPAGIQESFGGLLRRYRQAAGLTQEELAERAHLSARTVSDLERGLNLRPRKDSMALLAQALGLADAERARLEDAARQAALLPAAEQTLPHEPARAHGGLQSTQAKATNLPRALTSFVGRTREQAEVARLLQEAPLVTLTGAGGCGKTRLARQVAATLLAAYPDGVWLVELAPLADATLVPQAVAAALGVVEELGQPLLSTLVAFLQAKRLLLVLDNCEHLVGACAEVAGTLLEHCPELQVLATSREVLGVAGEHVWRVPSLSLPDSRRQVSVQDACEADAVRLFVERARAVRPTSALAEQNAGLVAEVCERLDGIPLALELAAARLSVLTLEELATRLDDRFRLLTSGSRTALPRQQTLRATLDWSWNLLSGAEQALLRRLAVFAGGWTLKAAEVVCVGEGIEAGEVLDLLGSLVNKSLVTREETRDGAGRFGLLETVRQYALEQLEASGEAAAGRERHLEWCLTLAVRAAPALRGAEQVAWLARLEGELDNLRAALRWAQEGGQLALGLQLAQALSHFWNVHSHRSEGLRWLERFLALATGDDANVGTSKALESMELATLRAWALGAASWLACMQCETRMARQRAEQSLALFRELEDPLGLADVLNTSGCVARDEGDFGRSAALLGECAALSRRTGNKLGLSASLTNLGMSVLQQGDSERAARVAQESLALWREIGDPWHIASALFLHGLVAQEQGDLERATDLGTQSLALFQETGDRRGIALALGYLLCPVKREQGDLGRALALGEESLVLGRELGEAGVIGWASLGLGQVATEQGELTHATAMLGEGLALFLARGMRWFMARCLAGLTQVACLQGHSQRAAHLAGATEALLALMNAALPRGERAGYGRAVDAARAALGDDAFTVAWQAGQTMLLEQVIAEALADAEPAEEGAG
jgi:non-specific serine/threonine protein kinase